MNDFKKTDESIYRISMSKNTPSIGVIAKTGNTVDYTQCFSFARREEKKILNTFTGINNKNIIFLNQVHQDKIAIVDTPPEKNGTYLCDADGIITSLPKICLVIRTADCVPVFFFDNKNNILGAVHSGWKGCRLSISGKIINKMNHLYGTKYRNIHVFILPSIGPDSYEVKEDVANLFEHDAILKGDKIYLNLWQNIENSLKKNGIPEENIFNSKICTLKNTKEFFSYRAGDSGSNLNFGFMI